MSGKKTPQSKSAKKIKSSSKKSQKKQEQYDVAQHEQKPSFLDILKRQMIQQEKQLSKTQGEKQLNQLIKKYNLQKQENKINSIQLQLIKNIQLNAYKVQAIRSALDLITRQKLKRIAIQLQKQNNEQNQNLNKKKQIQLEQQVNKNTDLQRINILKWINQMMKCEKLKERNWNMKLQYKLDEWQKQKKNCEKLLGKLTLISF